MNCSVYKTGTHFLTVATVCMPAVIRLETSQLRVVQYLGKEQNVAVEY
jgi:hypothetical protein